MGSHKANKEHPMGQEERTTRPRIRWSVLSYQMAAQSVMAVLLRQRGMTFHVEGQSEIHWGHTIAPACTIAAMIGAEAYLLGQGDWDVLWGRLQRQAMSVIPYMDGPEPAEQMMHRLYDRTYAEITQPDIWAIIDEAAEYYENTPKCTSEQLRRFVKRSLKLAQEKKQ
jgi:hypothetical protein